MIKSLGLTPNDLGGEDKVYHDIDTDYQGDVEKFMESVVDKFGLAYLDR